MLGPLNRFLSHKNKMCWIRQRQTFTFYFWTPMRAVTNATPPPLRLCHDCGFFSSSSSFSRNVINSRWQIYMAQTGRSLFQVYIAYRLTQIEILWCVSVWLLVAIRAEPILFCRVNGGTEIRLNPSVSEKKKKKSPELKAAAHLRDVWELYSARMFVASVLSCDEQHCLKCTASGSYAEERIENVVFSKSTGAFCRPLTLCWLGCK